MVVIIDFEVSTERFALGRLFDAFPDVEVELERIIPIGSGIMPLLWVSGADPEAVERELRSGPLVEGVELLTHADDRYLFEIDWIPDVDGLVRAMVEHEAELLRGGGGSETWEFRAQFRARKDLVGFREACLEEGIRIDLVRIYNPQFPAENQLLTDAQLDALLRSYEQGYWDVPRGVTLVELGETMGISDTATSQRLRRAVKTIIEAHVLPGADR